MPALIHTRLMSISHEEFLRILPIMLGPEDIFKVTEGGIKIVFCSEIVDIHLQPQPDITIASLRLPRLQVNIMIKPNVSDAFISRFDRVFQRGGG